MSEIEDQPAPLPAKGDIWLDVINDMTERRDVGIARYGTPLQAFNGRKPLVDAYQEVLDMAVYLRQQIIEAQQLREALEGMVQQFAHWSGKTGGYWSGGLSALEDALEALGWDDPGENPEARCDEPGCMEQATCGWPSRPGGNGQNGGYRRTCGNHMRQYQK